MRSLTGLLLITAGAVAALAVGWFFFSTTSDEQIFNQQISVTQIDTSQTPENGTATSGDASIAPQVVSPAQPPLQPAITAIPFSQSETGNTENKADEQQADASGALPEITIARVDPSGSAVLAGKAEPHASVIVSENGRELGRTKADDAGEWVIVLEQNLAQGNHLLIIEMQTEEGEVSRAGRAVLIELSGNDAPLVAIVPMDETADGNASEVEIVSLPKVLEQSDRQDSSAPGPKADTATKTEMAKLPDISIFTLSWQSGNMLGIKGEASSGNRVLLSFAGKQAQTDVMDNSWQAVIAAPSQSSGIVRLEAVLISAQGKQIARTTLDIDMGQLDIGKDGSDMVVVQKGDVLWRIAYRTYGSGIRYLDIVRRNSSRIDDPDLIFPAQIFSLPAQ